MNSLLKLTVLFFLLTACGPKALTVTDAWARPTAAGGTAAVYFELHNGSGQDDALLSVSSESAGATEIHHSMSPSDAMDGMIDHSGADGENEGTPVVETDVMIMSPVSRLELPAGERLVFEPGSYHVMLIDLKTDLVAGETLTVTLHFEHNPDIEIVVEVLAN